MIRLALAAALLLCLPLARRWGQALSLRLEQRGAVREREVARAARGKLLRPGLDSFSPSPEVDFLQSPPSPRSRADLLAALGDLRAEAQAAGEEDIALFLHEALLFRFGPPVAVMVRRPGAGRTIN